MSVLLTAGALILVSVLPGQNYSEKIIETNRKLERVEEAMRGFMTSNGRRPCPADGQAAVGTANFGLEAQVPGTCQGGSPAAPLGPNAAPTDVHCNNGTTGCIVSGTIPTKSLGLPDEYAFDEFGRRFTYVVDMRATKKATCPPLQDYPTNDGVGGLIINDGNGNQIDQTMYAYVSHGPTGHGGFPAQGGTRLNTGATDTGKLTNAGVDSSFNPNFTNVRVQNSKTKTFDDLVWYRPDIKNICCLGGDKVCYPYGIRFDEHNLGFYIQSQFWVGNILGHQDSTRDLIFGDGTNLFIVFGKTSSIYDWSTPLVTPTLMDGVQGVEIQHFYSLLDSVAIGDVNGDGYDDIIGCYNNASSNPGIAKCGVLFGGPTMGDGTPWPGVWDSGWNGADNTYSHFNGQNGFVITGNGASPNYPNGGKIYSLNIGGIADVWGHHDGTKDIILSAGEADPWHITCYAGGTCYSYAFVIKGQKALTGNTPFGGASIAVPAYFNGDNTKGFAAGLGGSAQNGTDAHPSAFYGGSAGDLNCDTYSDIVVLGASGIGGAGHAFILFGGPHQIDGTAWPAWPAAVDMTATADGTNGTHLYVYASVPYGWIQPAYPIHLHSGNCDDLYMGGNYSPNIFVFGQNSWPNKMRLDVAYNGTDGLNGDNGFFLSYGAGGGQSAAAADLNGDGKPDLIINNSTYTDIVYAQSNGKFPYSYPGSTGTFASLTSNPNGVNGFRILGDNSAHTCGNGSSYMWVQTADFNGDGRPDLIIMDQNGAPPEIGCGAWATNARGLAYLLWNPSRGWSILGASFDPNGYFW